MFSCVRGCCGWLWKAVKLLVLAAAAIAAVVGSIFLCHTLIDNSPTSTQRTPLSRAIAVGDLAGLKKELARGTNVNHGKRTGWGMIAATSPLAEAAKAGRLDMMEALLKAGADPSVYAESMGPFGLLFSTSPLGRTVFHGNPKMVETLLKFGADANDARAVETFGAFLLCSSPLGYAATHGMSDRHQGIVPALLAGGADPNVPATSVGPFGMIYTESPLFESIRKRDLQNVVELLKGGANPHKGSTLFGFDWTSPRQKIFSYSDREARQFFMSALEAGFKYHDGTADDDVNSKEGADATNYQWSFDGPPEQPGSRNSGPALKAGGTAGTAGSSTGKGKGARKSSSTDEFLRRYERRNRKGKDAPKPSPPVASTVELDEDEEVEEVEEVEVDETVHDEM